MKKKLFKILVDFAREIDPSGCCGVVEWRGKKAVNAECKAIDRIMTLMKKQQSQTKDKVRGSVELFMNTHDRTKKSFNTDDFIKFILNS